MADTDLTETLVRATDGSQPDSEKLFALLYDELREMAGREMRRERPDHTLQPTELVHEVFVRLIARDRCRVDDHRHFMALACRAMRQVLIDHARRRGRGKRGMGQTPVPLDEAWLPASPDHQTTILTIGEVMERFMERHPDKARLVDMHFFVGLRLDECAELLGVSIRTVSRNWAFAQAWLSREIMRG